ncbi:MAG: CinA family protein [Candidatus Hydrogenedens sp.]|jgi:PncC family amidohydrolase|nr:CinA family protein [Candidatus Hydrogenedens sp.]
MTILRSLEQELAERCAEASLSLAVAESCTGGLIAHRLTNVPGVSRSFQGGVVSYANSAKTALLGVPAELIEAEGAVSEGVALAMVEGVCARLGADLGAAVTGIAGPEGGTADKPVGTVWLAASLHGQVRSVRKLFEGSREEIKAQTADAAFSLMLELLENL